MNTSGNTILITGGATGIGYALAETLLQHDNTVIICGRREKKLQEAQHHHPQLHIKICDVSDERQRHDLTTWTTQHFPDLNILINNAGIQRTINFKTGDNKRPTTEDEIDINLKAPIRLSELYIPQLLNQPHAAIINVSSGLGFCPLAIMPVYCATKAALHSFTVSLRFQLRNTPIQVFEVIPPIVDTELDQGARDQRGQQNHGIPPIDVAAAVMKALEHDDEEITVGMATGLRDSARTNMQIFNRMNPQ